MRLMATSPESGDIPNADGLRRWTTVLSLNPITDSRWQRELAKHDQATVFHTAAWARVLQATYGFQPLYLSLPTDRGQDALLPLMEVRRLRGGLKAVSLPFTDSCALLLPAGEGRPDPSALQTRSVRPDAPLGSTFLRQVRSLAGERRWRSLELRLGLAERAGEAASVRFYNHVIPLESTDAAQLTALRPAVRRCLKNCQSSPLQITIGASLEMSQHYYTLHCLTRRRQGAPPQPWKFFRNIHQEILAHGMGYVVLASLGCRPVAGAVFLHYGRQAAYKFGASDHAFQSLRPNHGVMWTGIRHAARLGCVTLDLGRTSIENHGLQRFKNGWGALETTQVYHCLNLVTNRWQAAPDRTSGWQTMVFAHLPLWANRWLGRLLYRYVA